MLCESVLRLLAGLLIGIWVARFLGPEKFGLFSYVLAFSSIFAGVAKLGLDGIVIKELVANPDKEQQILGTSFWLKFAGSALVYLILFAVVKATSDDPQTSQLIFITAAGLFFQSFEVIDFFFQSKVQARFVSICKIFQLALSTILKIVLVLNKAELFWFIVVTLADSISLAISLMITYSLKEKKSFYRHFETSMAGTLLKQSWPVIFAGLVVMIYMRIDQIMIKEILGEREVGIYSAAVRLSVAWYFVPLLIAHSLFPAILNARKVSIEVYYSRLQRLFTLMTWLSLSVAVLITLFSRSLISALYGEAFLEASYILNIHVWAGIFVALGEASNKWFVAEGHNLLSFWRTFWGMISNIVLNFFLIPSHGAAGAAIATLIAYSIAGLFFDLFSAKTRLLFRMKIASLDPRRLF